MQNCAALYDEFAAVVKYPDAGFQDRARQCKNLLKDEESNIKVYIDTFVERMTDRTLDELEEQYIRTFDMNPTCSMDTGWQLFGEDYNRGLYMVKVRGEMRKFGIVETSELPDHLTNVLQVLGRMDEDDAISFARACVIPAVKKTLAGLSEDNSYHPLIQGLVALLESRYGVVVDEEPESSNV